MSTLNESFNCIPMGDKLTIAIDIDGTVADSSPVDFYRAENDPFEFMKAIPIEGAVEAVQALYDQGHKIVFHSSRTLSSKEATEAWLQKHGFPFHHLEMRKFLAHVYIDDRAIDGRNWNAVMRQIDNAELPGFIARQRGHV